MNLEQIKTAVDSGKRVCCGNRSYEVIHDNIGQWLIRCTANNSCIGLTRSDGVTLNENEDKFFVDNCVDQDRLRPLLDEAMRMLNKARLGILEGTRPGGVVSRSLAMEIAIVQDRVESTLGKIEKWRPKA